MDEPRHRLRRAREAAGYYSAAEAARAISGIKTSTLNSNENGHRAISRRMAVVYGEAFGVDPGWILYGTETEKPMVSGYSKEVVISVARELSEEGILPENDDNDSVAKAFLELFDEHARRINRKNTPIDVLKNHETA